MGIPNPVDTLQSRLDSVKALQKKLTDAGSAVRDSTKAKVAEAAKELHGKRDALERALAAEKAKAALLAKDADAALAAISLLVADRPDVAAFKSAEQALAYVRSRLADALAAMPKAVDPLFSDILAGDPCLPCAAKALTDKAKDLDRLKKRIAEDSIEKAKEMAAQLEKEALAKIQQERAEAEKLIQVAKKKAQDTIAAAEKIKAEAEKKLKDMVDMIKNRPDAPSRADIEEATQKEIADLRDKARAADLMIKQAKSTLDKFGG